MSQVVISQKVSCYNAKPSSYSKISFIANYGGYFWVQERKQIIKVLPGNLPRVNECATMPSINNVTKSSWIK